MANNYLESVILRSERKRLEIFIAFLSLVALLTFLLQLFHFEILKDSFRHPLSFPLTIFCILLMLAVFIINRQVILRHQKKKKPISKTYYWYTVITEVAIPSAWMMTASAIEETSSLLDSPVIFIYFILIIVSSLHLDFWLSAVMGMIISLFIAAFTFWATSTYPIEFHLPLVIYYVRSFMFCMSGICAGFVARELKRRVFISYKERARKQEIESLFSQQVSKEVVEVLKTKEDYTAMLDATIIFLDIRNFTKKVQHLTPEEVNAFQNQFFSPIIDIVNASKGIVNQIMGDGMMASFGAPAEDKAHYKSAWNAILAILEYLENFRMGYPNYNPVDIGIGMHCGEVLIGNIGTRNRKQLSISGTPVIVASRIEQLNKELDSTVLMSRRVFDLLKDQIESHTVEGMFKMKGLDTEIEVIRVF